MTTSTQQFVDDYMLVIENDQPAWKWHNAMAYINDKSSYALADIVRDEFEEYVNKALDKIDPSREAWQANVMRQMLLGWGMVPYEQIANEVLSRINEGK